jgi:triacylglycerol lipase
MWQLYAGPHTARGHAAPKVERDHSYGPDARHRLDVHGPAGPAADPRPVLLFVHGGGFTGGDKVVEGMPYYDHVGGWAVAHGFLGATITYRLAPAHPWPAGADDVAAAVAWTRCHIAGLGGDPDRIVLAGHSAGAVHVAGYLARHGRGGVAGAAMLSGIYDLGTAERNGLLAAYFGTDTSTYPQRSPLPGLLATTVPMFFSVAELDLPDFHRQAAGIVAALVARDGHVPPFVCVPGHNHISEIVSLGIDDALGAPLQRFLEQVTRL